MQAKRTTKTSTAAMAAAANKQSVASPDDNRQARIAEAAYFIAERRGFAPGCDLQNWLAAELQIQNESA